MNGLSDIIFFNIEYFFYQILLIFRRIGGQDVRIDDRFLEQVQAAYTVVAILLLVALAYFVARIFEMRARRYQLLRERPASERVPDEQNARWQFVMHHANSENPSDWRLAILEADSMLDDFLIKRGYLGDNLGERLKSVRPHEFRYLSSAWEGHKVRNRIAHEGSNFVLDKRATKQTVSWFEEFFRETGVI